MAFPYLTLATFRARTLMSVAEVDYVETDSPGFTLTRITIAASYVHARLRKRYGKSLPFGDPAPEAVLGWITALVTYDVLRKRGANPADPGVDAFKADMQKALDEIKEAADSKDGLFDLPSPEEGASNVTTGGPLGYSETSPYVWATKERLYGMWEDRNNDGTGDD